MMIAAALEKLGYVTTLLIMYGQSRVSSIDAQAAIPDSVLGILFLVAFARTRARQHRE
jgi:hypothetical protein